jgi:lysyl-tRNA synthetase class II
MALKGRTIKDHNKMQRHVTNEKVVKNAEIRHNMSVQLPNYFRQEGDSTQETTHVALRVKAKSLVEQDAMFNNKDYIIVLEYGMATTGD